MPTVIRKMGIGLAAVLGAFMLILPVSAQQQDQVDEDPFAQFEALDGTQMADLSGGESLNLGDVAVNLADQTAGISDTSMIGQFQNGQIANNTIEQLSGINSLMFNTGNNVNFLSSIQVNVFVQ